MVLRAPLGHVPLAQHRHPREPRVVLLLVRPQLEVADRDGHDVRQLRVPLACLELARVRLARVVDDAVDEARVVDELHLDHERRARPVPAPDVEDRELGPLRQGKLLARQVLDLLDGLGVGALEQVVEQAPEDVRVGREDPPEDEVVLQVGEGHALPLPPVRP